jgi:hypothetical protein
MPLVLEISSYRGSLDVIYSLEVFLQERGVHGRPAYIPKDLFANTLFVVPATGPSSLQTLLSNFPNKLRQRPCSSVEPSLTDRYELEPILPVAGYRVVKLSALCRLYCP